LNMGPQVFAIMRAAKNQNICAVANISNSETTVGLPLESAPDAVLDLISGKPFRPDSITLKPYQYAWLEIE